MSQAKKIDGGLPKESGYYWFMGHIYHEGVMGGSMPYRGLFRVVICDGCPFIAITHGTQYHENDMNGLFYGPVDGPPWQEGGIDGGE